MAEPDLGAATKEAREALAALNLKAEIARLSRPPPPRPLPQPEPGGAPSNAALSLACIGCARGCRQTYGRRPEGGEGDGVCCLGRDPALDHLAETVIMMVESVACR